MFFTFLWKGQFKKNTDSKTICYTIIQCKIELYVLFSVNIYICVYVTRRSTERASKVHFQIGREQLVIVRTWIVSVTNKYCKYYCVDLSSFGKTDHLTNWINSFFTFLHLLSLWLFLYKNLKCTFIKNMFFFVNWLFTSKTNFVELFRFKSTLYPKVGTQRLKPYL